MNNIDKQVGEQIKMTRLLCKKSRQELADGVKLSYHQIQKYENGTNSVKVGRLYEIAEFLKVSVVQLLPSNVKEND